MYTLYWNPLASSLAPMAVLEETGVAYDLHRVDSDGGECESREYREIQPLGLIPALGLPDGGSMFESAAIVQFLSDRHAAGELAPRPEGASRSRYLQWLHFMAGTVYPTYNRYYCPERFSADSQSLAEIRTHLSEIVLQQWQVLEDLLNAGGPWVLGGRFSACDIYLQMMTTWHRSPAELLGRFPAVRNLCHAVSRREACRRAIDRHGFDTGLAED